MMVTSVWICASSSLTVYVTTRSSTSPTTALQAGERLVALQALHERIPLGSVQHNRRLSQRHARRHTRSESPLGGEPEAPVVEVVADNHGGVVLRISVDGCILWCIQRGVVPLAGVGGELRPRARLALESVVREDPHTAQAKRATVPNQGLDALHHLGGRFLVPTQEHEDRVPLGVLAVVLSDHIGSVGELVLVPAPPRETDPVRAHAERVGDVAPAPGADMVVLDCVPEGYTAGMRLPKAVRLGTIMVNGKSSLSHP